MRIWDIDPGYLSRQRLLGEHRELHGLHVVVTDDRRGYRHHPETLRWEPCIHALRLRHSQLLSEMLLRGYRHQSPLPPAELPIEWPEVFLDSPGRQLQLLREKYAKNEEGRIPLPRNSQQLWAQHKYSVMARSTQTYKEIGSAVAGTRRGPPEDSLVHQLVAELRAPAPWPRSRNALTHMWGYVSSYVGARETQEMVDWLQDRPRKALARIAELAYEHQVEYLLHSTALGELMCHLPETHSEESVDPLKDG